MSVVSGLVHVAGNAVLDVLVRDVELQDVIAQDAWGANVQLLSRPVEAALGGCGAAPAYVLGHLGARVVLNANMGGDAWGQLLAQWLEGVGVELLPSVDDATAAHVIALALDGRRRSFYHTGPSVVWERSLEAETPEWFLVSGYGKVAAADLGALLRVCGEMRRRGAQVLFDPSPWFAGRADVAEMHALWAEVDCLSATEEELAEWEKGENCGTLAKGALARGVANVVIKRGGQGAFYARRDGGCGQVEVAALAGANTVGAGDSFNGRLVYGLCRGEELGVAVAAAVQLATRVVCGGRGVLGLAD
ncbi:MAG: carbohydrate kinase family protein [Candidatus Latescibacterota bacterium]|nr:carbohydrate kinase family protein [Candidatus Latescibacterota bacterium]